MENIVLFLGPNSYLIEEDIKKSLEQLQIAEFNTIDFDLLNSSVLELLEELDTSSLFLEKKAIIIKNISYFYKLEKADLNLLTKYFKNPNKDAYLFLITDKIDNNKEFSQLLANYALIKTIADLDKNGIQKRVLDIFLKKGFKIGEKVCEFLVERTKSDLYLLDQEIAKLTLYKNEDKEIFFDDVSLLVSLNLEDSIYELINVFFAGDIRKIESIFLDLMALNEEPLRIISSLGNKFLEILQIKYLLSAGNTQDDIALYFKVKSGRAYYMIKNANRKSIKEIEHYIKKLSNLDFMIKSGAIDKKIGLEFFLLS